jgi:hypothetical protein
MYPIKIHPFLSEAIGMLSPLFCIMLLLFSKFDVEDGDVLPTEVK